jgi:hypothetical protein
MWRDYAGLLFIAHKPRLLRRGPACTPPIHTYLYSINFLLLVSSSQAS